MGHIQDILLGIGINLMAHCAIVIITEEEFQLLQDGFLEKNYHHFEYGEENKFIYTDIFKQYVRRSQRGSIVRISTNV